MLWLVGLLGGSGAAQSPRREVDWQARVAAGLRAREYHFSRAGFSRVEGKPWSAPNRAQGLRSRVGSAGLEVFPRATDASGEGAEWKLRLRTAGFHVDLLPSY